MRLPEDDEATAGDVPDLGSGFAGADIGAWRALVAGVLRKSGVDPDAAEHPEELLAHTTYDGIRIDPLYTRDSEAGESGMPGLSPFTRGGRAQGAGPYGWDVRAEHRDPDPAATRTAVLADLENGATSLWLHAGAAGLPESALAAALTDVHLGLAPVVLDAGADYAGAAGALLTAHDDAGVPPGEVRAHLGIDPLSAALRTGDAPDVALAARVAAGHADRYPNATLMTADATPVHDAGGSEAQELGASMAAGVCYLRALTAAGLGLGDAAARVEFRYAASADQFLTIAKLRAARAMWARVASACGLTGSAAAMRQHAVTSAAMMSRRSPYVNMLRTTLACFGAGVGGADAVTVRPFDHALGLPDAFSRRIARNTQSLLVEEAHLARVIDPVGGSFYGERLTADLYAQGWAFFQALEAAGGLAAAEGRALLGARVEDVWRDRRARLADRTDPLTGVSEFPDAAEAPLRRRPAPKPPEGPGGLPRRRYAEEFEALRDRCDAHGASTGARPRVFLATLGPVAAHNARAMFTANLLQSGGIEPVPAGATEDAGQVAAAFAESGTGVAVLCGSDRLYTERAAETVAALRAAGARRVLLAGDPDTVPDAGNDRPQAVDGAVAAGGDAIGLLTELCDSLGVAT
ncbi:heterodimeric methylmalonyl-CoA mutase small subunit [Murinocardiopsis flavida]|uniref:methylmalonyl-CoA mutase n=1 Tax=Murinocardiopsis flavida TaxID=645275 RepID=A0A2P8DQS2_9ACTN|nr:methylmalonyl-CoA mutase family protein [Murinocardiopsis flavida]PSK99552.1 heterodimeric methylmalonyl-CoA mutase small subunit [Murinocardiopsis flavida]